MRRQADGTDLAHPQRREFARRPIAGLGRPKTERHSGRPGVADATLPAFDDDFPARPDDPGLEPQRAVGRAVLAESELIDAVEPPLGGIDAVEAVGKAAPVRLALPGHADGVFDKVKTDEEAKFFASTETAAHRSTSTSC